MPLGRPVADQVSGRAACSALSGPQLLVTPVTAVNWPIESTPKSVCQVNEPAALLLHMSVTAYETEYVPGLVTVPVTAPVAASTATPGGRPVADQIQAAPFDVVNGGHG